MNPGFLLPLCCMLGAQAVSAELPSNLRNAPPLPGMYARSFAGEGHLRTRSSPEGPLEIVVNSAAPNLSEHTLDVHTIYVHLQRLPPQEYKLRTTFFAAVRTTYGHLIGLERPLKSVDVAYVLLDFEGTPLGDEAFLVQWAPVQAATASNTREAGPRSR